MIIFGTRGITYRKDGGRFFCPECDGEQPYDRKRVRRFFTLYFIPLIPLNLLAEYIECPRCGGTYREDILSCDPRAAKEKVDAEFHRAVRRVMIGMMSGLSRNSRVSCFFDDAPQSFPRTPTG